MSEDTYYVYGGSYASEQDAKKDYDGLTAFYSDESIGTYEVAIFSKKPDGKVDIINTRASRRGTGAAIGAGVVGVAALSVVGLFFPFAIIGAAAVGGAGGALIADWTKPFSHKDIKEMGEALEAGEYAVVVVTQADGTVPADKLLPNAVKSESREITDAKALHQYLKAQD